MQRIPSQARPARFGVGLSRSGRHPARRAIPRALAVIHSARRLTDPALARTSGAGGIGIET
uniref:Uncharacterized protein n=1 Tax=Candidatus Kentrum eta TaxID=2126337 RepID=A0A450V7F9_9GAMM|nr:MAG: hypothetical protein BECKH772A_GA0070896_100545 [Candidatus Kentron sp. H]VFJ94165.1 MAG: hypothetical protein BECKH772B_GA0070898_1005611 [Candidatus Kentron sp. H]VFK00762.1 MAG: hypothetical protein BECKH772C_GA0070978_100525 [Candidatus Kentron sp. H]